MASAFAHFQRGLHLVLTEVVLELQKVFHCVLVIGIDGDPFTTLCGRVYGVQADRNFADQQLGLTLPNASVRLKRFS